MKENPIDRECPTFNALDRQAMFFGIPLIALAISGLMTIMAVMIALPFLQGKALLIVLLPIPFLLFLKTVSANDDQAFKIIPQDLSPSKKSNVSKVAMAGIGVVAIGLIVSGLIAVGSGKSETVVQNTQPIDEIKNNQPKDFEQDKSQLALDLPPEEIVETGEENTLPTEESTPEEPPEQTAQTTEQKEPEETPRQRKMRGNVLVDFDGGRDRGENNATAEAQTVSFNDGGSDSGSLGEKLKPTSTYQATAQKRADSTYLLSKGTNIPCTLDTQIITTHAGFTRCLVTKDVYSANGRVLLLERGSKLVGEQTSALVQGQARVFVLWNEVETPNGVRVNIASTGAGQLGIDDYLNRTGITEVMINRPYEVFLEGSEGIIRIENEALSYSKLLSLANALAIYNSKSINHLQPMQSVALPDGERGHIMMPPSCEDKTIVFGFRKPSNTRFSLDDYLSTNRLQAFSDVGSFGKAKTDKRLTANIIVILATK